MVKYQKPLGIFLFLALCYFPLFLHLDTLSLRQWDESRRGVNALEMATEGHWLVPHFEGHPDMYGTKPPVLVWLQAIGMKIFGVNELAIRLPSALAGLATVFLLWFFAHRILERKLAGYFAGLVLLTSQIYIDKHAAITGDYDALLTLFQTFYLMCFYLFLKREENKYLYLTGLGVLLAGWTKGVAGLFFLPALVVFVFVQKKAKFIFTNKRVYLAGLATILGILSYYFLREQVNPGYLETVWGNELGGRFFEAREGYQRPFGFYIAFLFKHQSFHPWIYLLPLGFLLSFWDKKSKDFSKLALFNILLFTLIISSSKTKFEWYILPIIPISALIVALGLEKMYHALESYLSLNGLKSIFLFSAFILAFFAYPYYKIIQKVYVFEHSGWEAEKVAYASFMKRNPDIKAYTILHPSYNGHVTFYKKQYNLKGYQIQQKILQAPRSQVQIIEDVVLAPDQYVMICEDAALKDLRQNFETEEVSRWGKCQMRRIKGKKVK